MAQNSSIEWTEATWNPVTGCTKISPGCKFCYAERMAKRLEAMGQQRYRNGFELTLQPDALDAPLHWKKPRVIFVNSMSDLFHRDVPLRYIQRCFEVMEQANWHTFQVLTKRPERAAAIASELPWPDNVWMGTSVENADYLWRIAALVKIPARVRFLSVEPLLGPIPVLPLEGVHWVIVGGESGPGARPVREEWIIQIRDQCVQRSVPFFFKQWGGMNKQKAGRILAGRTWDEMPGKPAKGKALMANTQQTVWRAEPHTFAKHAILRRYLEAWFPILSRQARQSGRGTQEILYIDGFAGPGEYEGKEPGSPVIAIQAALNHSLAFPVPVRMLFLEERQDRLNHLRGVLHRYSAEVQQSPNIRLVEPQQGDCNELLGRMLDEYEARGARFGPALAFLDQFGCSAVSMSLVERILKYPQCEVFVYLDYKDMNRWITDPTKAPSFTRAYGGEQWREAINLPERKRQRFLLTAYQQAVRDRVKDAFVQSFGMYDKNGVLLYWLVFCSCHLRGLEEMKKAMWYVDNTGEFRFSDKDDPDQLKLLELSYGQDWLAEELRSRLAGQTMTVGDVKAHVLTQTPCYLYREALGIIEMNNSLQVLNAPPRRRKGTFSDDNMRVRFESPGLF
jgi:three-Cys-motif partner protein